MSGPSLKHLTFMETGQRCDHLFRMEPLACAPETFEYKTMRCVTCDLTITVGMDIPFERAGNHMTLAYWKHKNPNHPQADKIQLP